VRGFIALTGTQVAIGIASAGEPLRGTRGLPIRLADEWSQSNRSRPRTFRR
jgi:hypothetical protein